MKKDSKSESSANLRQKAEALYKKNSSKSGSTPNNEQTLRLIHDLEVHKIELEMQNEELRLAKEKITVDAEKYADLFDFAPSGYFTLARNGEIIELNFCGSRMLGNDRTFLISKMFGIYVSDDSKPIFSRFLDTVFSSKSQDICEVALKVNNNLPMYVHLSGSVTENGEQCLIIAMDITDRKMSEVALRESDEMFSAFMRHSPIYAFIKEVNQQESRVLKASENFRDMIGICGSEMAGKTMYQLFPAEYAAKFTADDWKVVSNGEGVTLDEDLNGRNYTSIKFPIDLGGKTLLAGYTIDITERKQAEDALRESEKQYTSLFNNFLDSVAVHQIVLDETGKPVDYIFIQVNEAFTRQTGLRMTDILGKRVTEVIPGIEKTPLIDIYGKVVLTGEPVIFEQFFEPLQRYFHINAFKVDQRRFCVIFQDITDRRQFELILIANEQKYRTLFENMSQGVFYQMADGAISDANEAALEMFGLTRDQFLGRTSFDPQWKITDEQGATLAPQQHPSMVALISGKPCYSTTVAVYNPSQNHYRWLVINAIPAFKAGETKPDHVFVTMHDITERKQSEERLKKSEQKFRSTISNLDEGYYSVTMDGLLLEHNQAFCRILGFDSTADLKGVRLPGYWQYPDEWKKYLEAISANNSVSNYQINVVSRTGEKRSVLANAHLVKDGDGHPLRIEAVFLDITDRIRLEESLQRHSGRLQNLHKIDKAILSGVETPEAIIQKTLHHIRSLLSSQHASIGMFDFEKETLQLFTSNIKDQSIDVANRYLISNALGDLEILRGKRMDVAEDISTRSLPPDLQQIFQSEGIMSCINVPLVSGEKLIGVMNLGWEDPRSFTPEELEIASEVADEITIAIEQVRLRQAAKHYAEELEKRVEERTSQLLAANEELEAFSYSVSHDLRAPLRHINGYISILSKRLQNLPEKEKHYLETIADSARQMGVLIDDLLNFSRTGRKEMQLTTVDMNVVLQDAMQVIKHESFGRGIKWEVAELPQVVGDYSLLRLVWLNLLNNSVKFLRVNVSALIEVGFVDDNNEFVFFVRDNGVGFDMQYAHKLFGVFERLHSAQEFEGTGIGLANVRRIILRHNGRIWAEAEVDKGATFYFSLPKG